VGTVFRMNIAGGVTVLHRFSGLDGAAPYGALLQATDGGFYGTTTKGGTTDDGTVFRLTAAGDFQSLHSFGGQNDGATPYASLIQAVDGNFYGTTWGGGAHGGTIFGMDIAGNVSLLHSFDENEGLNPYAGLIQAADGNFYGITGSDVTLATIYRLDSSGHFTVVYRFGYATANPYAALVQGDDGNLFGVAAGGGVDGVGAGTVFRTTPSGAFAALYGFDIPGPVSPSAALIEGLDGELYGTTYGSGYNYGTIFRVNPWGVLSTLHIFEFADGIAPTSAVLQVPDGNFYGTVPSGGYPAWGTVYRLDSLGEFTILHNFQHWDGAYPSGSLILGEDNDFYGLAAQGGTAGFGTLFRMTSAGSVTTLHNFAGGADGDSPTAALTRASDGYLYGTTWNTIFKSDSTGNVTTLHVFDGSDGSGPFFGLLQALDGNFYGLSFGGGTMGWGTFFRLSPSGEFASVFSFHGNDGAQPFAGLIQAVDGNLYGTTLEGGDGCASPGSCGTIFRTTYSGLVTVVHGFNSLDGRWPLAALVQASDGRIYGTASEGGPFGGMGVVFRLSNAQIAVNEVSPGAGYGEAGAALTVLGAGFAPGARVTIGSLDATDVTVLDPTFLYLRMPVLPPGTYDVTVTAPEGASATHSAAYVVNTAGLTITNFIPTAGPIGVGVNISGAGFTGVSSVKFNGKAASFRVLSPTQLRANVSTGTTSGKITVTTTAGTATSATDFIVAFPPTVTGFNPGSGVPGSSVVITGTNFDTANAVAFNGSGASFTINSPTQITATVPSLATSGKIKVTNAAGGAYSVAAFLVPPTITSFSPTFGHAGTTVTINGSTFTNASSVTFNGIPATFSVYSSVKITATVPPGVTTGKIAVTTPGGTGFSATSFGVPAITSFTPAAGPIGVSVTIDGTGFTNVSAVKFNGKAASFSVLSSTQLKANVSSGTTSGKITVTTADGTATSATNFLVVVPPMVTGPTPGGGVPGTSVVIIGTSFDTATAVAFNGFGAAFTINSPTQITATVPSSATTGKIKVTNAAGAASSVASFLVPPTITSFSPTSGHAGITVTINGTTFNNVSSVTFNGVPASFSVYSSIKITATVPSGATTGKIKVITGGGSGTSATNFTVLP